jgi:A/G-specific adenine glycosylase
VWEAVREKGGEKTAVPPTRAPKTPTIRFFASEKPSTKTTQPQIRTALLAWYDEHHRVLPWRRNPHSKRGGKAAAGGAPLDAPQQKFMYGALAESQPPVCVWWMA